LNVARSGTESARAGAAMDDIWHGGVARGLQHLATFARMKRRNGGRLPWRAGSNAPWRRAVVARETVGARRARRGEWPAAASDVRHVPMAGASVRPRCRSSRKP
jgi:hypothetical protein